MIEDGKFQTDKRNYDIPLGEYNTPNSVITISGEAEEEGAELVFKPESITLPIDDATTIAVYHADDLETPAYTVVLMPSQDENTANYDLLHLSLHFNADGANLIQGFSGASQSYSVNLEKGVPSSVFVEAKAASRAAQVKITDGQYQLSESSAVVAVPTSGSKVVTVSVKRQADLAYKNYDITLNAYAPTLITYAGTIEGVNAPYTITGLIAREADSTSGQAARLGATPTQWSLTMNSDWTPHSFIVEMKDTNRVSYKSAVIVPQSVVEQGTVVTVAGFGKVLASVQDMQSINSAPGGNYVLGQDLDLGENGVIWGDGNYAITGFSGHFYGNGYTIDNLKFTSGNRNRGLFNTLGNNACIEDFTIKARTEENPTLSSFYFGSVIGNIQATGVVVRKIKAFVDFEFAGFNSGHANVGGIIGGTEGGGANSVTIDKCVSFYNVKIEHSSTSGPASGTSHSFGGLIAHGGGEVTITDSYAVCNVNILLNADVPLNVGGLMGQSWNSTWKIENSYAAGDIVVRSTIANTAYSNRTVGGITGGVFYGTLTIDANNSAALLQTALNIQTGVPGTDAYGRITSKTHTSGLSNNYALDAMLTGTTAAGATVSSGLANNKDGLNKSAADFKNPATWSALGFNTAVWDFSTIARDGRPTLR